MMLRSLAARSSRAALVARTPPSPWHRSLSVSNRLRAKDPVELDSLTTLPNGIRVASENLPGHFSGIGVYLDAGSRYENAYLSGASHIIDRLAFKATSKRSADQMLEAMEMLGGNMHCASSRESLIYQAATFNSAVPDGVALLAETIRDPMITPEEIEQQLETASYEISEIWAKPELILPELVHVAAYRNNTLGNPLLCPEERLSSINRDVIEAYRKTFYLPERMVVAFAGVEHGEAVRLTEKWFGDMQRSTDAQRSAVSSMIGKQPSQSGASYSSYQAAQPHHQKSLLSRIPIIKNLSTTAAQAAAVLPDSSLPFDLSQPAHYTGGFLSIPPAPNPTPTTPPLTHIHVAFESPPITSPDIYAVAVLQMLLGGGGSFSAGGPGKGMYSRLYTSVLNQHAWVESCVAFNHGYADSGVFGVAASCGPLHAASMLDVICRELAALAADPNARAGPPAGVGRLRSLHGVEVERAKNQLRSNLLMNLESRLVELEDLGRQVQTHGRRIGVAEMCERIDTITVEDLRRTAESMFRGAVDNPGRGTGLPTVVLQEAEGFNAFKGGWQEIQERIYKAGLGRR